MPEGAVRSFKKNPRREEMMRDALEGQRQFFGGNSNANHRHLRYRMGPDGQLQLDPRSLAAGGGHSSSSSSSPLPPDTISGGSLKSVARSDADGNSDSNNAVIASGDGELADGLKGSKWYTWISLPGPRIGGFAMQTDHYLFVIGGSSESVAVPALRGSTNSTAGNNSTSTNNKKKKSLVMVDAFSGKPIDQSNNKTKTPKPADTPSPTQRRGTPENDVFLFINLLVAYRYTTITLSGDNLPPIASKAGFALAGYDIYLSYACDVSTNGTASGLFIKVSFPPGEMWRLEENPQPAVSVRVQDPSSQRYAASLGQYDYLIPNPNIDPDAECTDAKRCNVVEALPAMATHLYLFGGRDSDMRPISTVEHFFNGSWSVLEGVKFPKPYCLCSVTQGLFGAEREDALYITDCHDCESWEPVGDAIVFLPQDQLFVFANAEDESVVPDELIWPDKQGITGRDLLGRYLVGITYSPQNHVADPLALMLYDTFEMRQIAMDELHPSGIENVTTNCAIFTMAGYVMCLGGQFVNSGRASMWSYSVELLPAVYAMMNRSNGIYYTGETPTLVTSGACGDHTMFMLATDPDCRVRIPYTKPFACKGSWTSIPISHLDVSGPDDEIEMYICATEGSCHLHENDRLQCKSSSPIGDEYSCIAARCCWDKDGINPSTGRPMPCFRHGPLSAEDDPDDGGGMDGLGRGGVSWMQTTALQDTPSFNPRPLVLMRPPIVPDRGGDTQRFPQWLMIVMVVVGTALITLLGILSSRYRRLRQQMQKRRAYATNAFFAAFGKAYQVQGLIGQGSYGAVFLAERARDKRLVALKIIPCWDHKQRDMALREFDLLNSLSHPHLIPVLDLIINWDSRATVDANTPFDTISKKSRLHLEASGCGGGMRHAQSGSELDTTCGESVTVSPDGGGITSHKSAADAPIAGDSGGHNNNKGGSGKEGLLLGAAAGGVGSPKKTPSSVSFSPTSLDANPASPLRRASSQLCSTPLLSSPQHGSPTNGGNNNSSKSQSFLDRERAADAAALTKGSDLSDMIPCSSSLPSRFICIATEFFPEGDLTRFVTSYPRRGAIIIGDHDPLECVMHYEQVGEALAQTQQQRDREREREKGGGNNALLKGGAGTAGGLGEGYGGTSLNNAASVRSTASNALQSNMYAFAELSGGDPQTTRPIPEITVLSYCQQIAEVLAYMHGLSPPLVHRDLKPDNVLVDKDRVVVTDFGLSSWQTNAESGIAADTCVGTLFFTAPEALGGYNAGASVATIEAVAAAEAAAAAGGASPSPSSQPPAAAAPMNSAISPAVDCWALGCILYAVCTRRVLPETARVMFSDVDDDDFESDIRGDLALGGYSSTTADIILALLRREPEERMTAPQAVEALRNNINVLKERAAAGGGAGGNGYGVSQGRSAVSIRNFLRRE